MVRMLVEDGLSVATISRTLKLRQKPLYRRIHQVLASLRARLEDQGLSAQHVADLLAMGDLRRPEDVGMGKSPGGSVCSLVTTVPRDLQNVQKKQNAKDGRKHRKTKRMAR